MWLLAYAYASVDEGEAPDPMELRASGERAARCCLRSRAVPRLWGAGLLRGAVQGRGRGAGGVQARAAG